MSQTGAYHRALPAAVIFDLYDTLVDYDDARSREFSAAVADLLDRDSEEFQHVWRDGRPIRDTGPLAPYLAQLGIDGHDAERLLEMRRSWSRELLSRPREGAVETLTELRNRGIRTGLITVCSEDAVDVWPETPFADLFDAAVFSCSVGYRKPDPRIYLLACEQLWVEPEAAIFVGDGANDELAGAQRVGMRAVLIHRDGDPTAAQRFSGARVTALSQLLDLLDDPRLFK